MYFQLEEYILLSPSEEDNLSLTQRKKKFWFSPPEEERYSFSLHQRRKDNFSPSDEEDILSFSIRGRKILSLSISRRKILFLDQRKIDTISIHQRKKDTFSPPEEEIYSLSPSEGDTLFLSLNQKKIEYWLSFSLSKEKRSIHKHSHPLIRQTSHTFIMATNSINSHHYFSQSSHVMKPMYDWWPLIPSCELPGNSMGHLH